MIAVPLSLKQANRFVRHHHRHHEPCAAHRFSIGAVKNGALVGVVIVNNPVSTGRDDGQSAEVLRLCSDGTDNACSFLYGAAARAARELGY